MADWSRAEVDAIVADYLNMLELDLLGARYNKSQHRRQLARSLDHRSDGAIERKHQNISAVLIELGFPYLPGYKPLRNYQRVLLDAVVAKLEMARSLHEILSREVERFAESPHIDGSPHLEPPPEMALMRRDRVEESSWADELYSVPRFTNYLERESRNMSLGAAGEAFIMRFEVARLMGAGRPTLAENVEHVSVTRGDGLGFDILSYERDGGERLIEVKTTTFGKETPFFLTRNELTCSRKRDLTYHLYRVYSFRNNPRVFALDGRLDTVCHLSPMQWSARVL